MAGTKKSNIRLTLVVPLIVFFFVPINKAQVTIPAKYDGFVFSMPEGPDFISIEAFLDPICSDSRDSWQPLKQLIDYYGSSILFIVHPFALPYHDNAFVTSRALHIVDKINSDATYTLLDKFFEHQEEFYNARTINLSRASVIDMVTKFASNAVGQSYNSAIKTGFKDSATDQATRISFKYGCTRGVFGAPFFFVNGFALPNPGSPVDYKTWRSIIDPLVVKKGMERQNSVQSS